MRRNIACCFATLVASVLAGLGAAARPPAEVALGERLFFDPRFVAERPSDVGAHPTVETSCAACHGISAEHVERPLQRRDARAIARRKTGPLFDAIAAEGHLLHFDGEFASPETLVKETFLGRNHGWLPGQRAEALRHFMRVIREERGARDCGDGKSFSYATLLRGIDPAIPAPLRLPPAFRIDADAAAAEAILDACARLVVTYLRTLAFSRDEGGHDGSPYDAFLAANRLPRAPKRGQPAMDYARLLGEQVAGLRAPRFVNDPARSMRTHGGQPFRFGERELRGMRIFFREAIGPEQAGGAGNCAECHVPPRFTDFRFHNTGSAQDEYDAVHGSGAFARLFVPDVAERNADFTRWLPPTTLHRDAIGPFFSVPIREQPGRADLGLWNVYANPDLPAPQPALERLMNPAGIFSRADVLGMTLGRFRTTTVRNLGHSAPYLHTGHRRTIEDVIVFYQRMSELARAGGMRNAPPAYFAMRLSDADIEPLAAFLRALNEEIELRAPEASRESRELRE